MWTLSARSLWEAGHPDTEPMCNPRPKPSENSFAVVLVGQAIGNPKQLLLCLPCLAFASRGPDVPGKAASAVVAAQPKSRIFLDDVVSKSLFDEWHAYATQQGVPETAYFFPSLGKNGFLWHTKLTYAMADKFVQEAASALSLCRDTAHLKCFTTKALRRGTAAESMELVRACLRDRNHLVGRSSSSHMETKVYCPQEVLGLPRNCKQVPHRLLA